MAICLLAVLILTACGGDGDAARPTSVRVEPTVVVSTVEPTAGGAEPATAESVSATAPPTASPTVTPPAPLAAQVNGQYIFLADYEQRVAQYEQALVEQGLDPDSDDGQTSLTEVRREVLESLIDYVLIEQGGAELGVSLTEEELEAQIEADIAAGGGQAAFDEWLQVTGQTRDEYREMLRQAMLSQRVLETVTVDVPEVTEQVHARHILVESPEAAQQILDSLEAGSDFVSLVREHSLDLATKDNGGDLGWFPRGLVARELEVVAFGLQPGEVSDVVPMGDGYHILQVVERDPARALSPEMQVDLGLALFDQWLAEQRAMAEIERFVGE